MKINLVIKEKIKNLSFLFIFLYIFLFQINSPILNALPMDTYQSGPITEELRLKIPSEFKKVWLQAEKEVWEPWLSCLLYTSPSPRDATLSRMPSSA